MRELRRYHEKRLVLASDGHLHKGGGVSLLDASSDDPLIAKLVLELQKTKPMLHPDILGSAANPNERETVKGFLIGLCGVQKLDVKAVCKEAILPKITITAPKPDIDDLINYTNYCYVHLSAEIPYGTEIWIATKSGEVRPAKEVFFSSEFRPPQNWETNQQYVDGLRQFVSQKYLKGNENDEELKAWREFFKRVGISESPNKGVEDFAINFAMEKLKSRFTNIEQVEDLNFGYDLTAQDSTGRSAQIEVKGLSTDADVAFTANESDAAYRFRDSYHLCVVSMIPNSPTIRLVQDPIAVGKKEIKLLIPITDWQAGQRLA